MELYFKEGEIREVQPPPDLVSGASTGEDGETITLTGMIIDEGAFIGADITRHEDSSPTILENLGELRVDAFADCNFGTGHEIIFPKTTHTIKDRAFKNFEYTDKITFEIKGSGESFPWAIGDRPDFGYDVFMQSEADPQLFPDEITLSWSDIYFSAGYMILDKVNPCLFEGGLVGPLPLSEVTVNNHEFWSGLEEGWAITMSMQFAEVQDIQDPSIKQKIWVVSYNEATPNSVLFYAHSNTVEGPWEKPTSFIVVDPSQAGDPNAGAVYSNQPTITADWGDVNEEIELIVPSGEFFNYACGNFRERTKFTGKIIEAE